MKFVLAAALVALAFISTATARPPQTEEERTAALRTLTWRDGALALPISHGTLQAPDGISQLLGKDAAPTAAATPALPRPTTATSYSVIKGIRREAGIKLSVSSRA
ncbi:hypothetical protein BH10PSE6_BH10PSE6_00350 [soil metagenome]